MKQTEKRNEWRTQKKKNKTIKKKNKGNWHQDNQLRVRLQKWNTYKLSNQESMTIDDE